VICEEYLMYQRTKVKKPSMFAKQ